MTDRIKRDKRHQLSIIGEVSVLCSHCRGLNGGKCSHCEEWNGEYVGRFYYNFVSEVKSAATVYSYTNELKRFAVYLGLHHIDQLETFYKLGNNDKEADINNLTNIIRTYNKKDLCGRKGIAAESQDMALSAIFAIYDANRVKLEKDFIRRSITEKIADDDENTLPYSGIEVEKIFGSTGNNLCYRAVTPFLTSTGMRVGGIYETYSPKYTIIAGCEYSDNFLKIKDFEPAINEIEQNVELLEYFNNKCSDYGVQYEEMFKVSVYRHSGKKKRYDTYCSHEATLWLKKYWQSRIDAGEPTGPDGKLLPDAPAFRNRFGSEESRAKGKKRRDYQNKIRIENINNPRPLRSDTIDHYIARQREKVGVRPDTVSLHSFRKFYETEMAEPRKDGFMEQNYRRLLMGQKPIGIGKHYNIPGPEKLLPEYLRYVYRVTIDQTQVLRVKVKDLETTQAEEIKRTKNTADAALAGVVEIVRGLQKDREDRERSKMIPIEQEKPQLEYKTLSKKDKIHLLKTQLEELEKEE